MTRPTGTSLDVRIQTPTEFVARLRGLRLWAGQPSFRRIQQLAGTTTVLSGHVTDVLPRSTISTILRRDKLPRADFVQAFVSACMLHRGRPAEEIAASVEEWLGAWFALAAADESDHADPAAAPTATRVGLALRLTATSPRHLPPDVIGLAGREADIAGLDGVLNQSERQRVVVISGMAGVGKTALSVRWAHRIADRFPDGHLYLDLRGPTGEGPVRTEDALRILLRGLGVPPDQIPVDPESRLGAYRTLLVARRVLIMLDNAVDARQVRPLLPASRTCMAVITSRNRLSLLAARDSAYRLTLGPLEPAAARATLRAAIGNSRPPGTDDELDELARLCARLPLALRIAGTNLADRPQLTVRDYAARLRNSGRLVMLAVDGDDENTVRAAFDESYRRLDRDTQRFFSRLGRLTESDFSVEISARLAQVTPMRARKLLHKLTAEHLIEPTGAERFTFNELLRDYARHLAEVDNDLYPRNRQDLVEVRFAIPDPRMRGHGIDRHN